MSILWFDGDNNKFLNQNTPDPREKITIESTNIVMEHNSIKYLALMAFLEQVDELCCLHVMNNMRGKENDLVLSWYSLDNMSFITNSGLGFYNNTFILHAYDWSEIQDVSPTINNPNAFNFLDLETKASVSWYKYSPRGLTTNHIMDNLFSQNDGLQDMISRIHKSLNA